MILLYLAAMNKGFSSNAWLTYKQAQAMGGQVMKGAKSVRCIFYKTIEVEDESSDGVLGIFPRKKTKTSAATTIRGLQRVSTFS